MCDFTNLNIELITDEYEKHKEFIKYIRKTNKKIEGKSKEIAQISESYNIYDKNKYLWIFYIIENSYDDYLNIDKKFVLEQKYKFNLIDRINKNNEIKDKDKYESVNDIGNNNKLSISTIRILCEILEENIVFESGGFCEINKMNDKNEYYVIDVKKNILKISKISKELIENNYYIVKNIEKSLKSISSYKLSDLQKICMILDKNYNIMKINNGKEVKKTKNELYEYIKLCC